MTDSGIHLGNVHTDDVADLWNSDRMRRFRRENYLGPIDECRNCSSYKQNGESELLVLQEVIQKIQVILVAWAQRTRQR